MSELDTTDLRILSVLQVNSDLSTSDLAEKVGISQSPCWRRVQRLKREGYVLRTVAHLDRKKLGLNAQIFARIKLSAHGRTHLTDFAKAVQGFPEVLECYVLMGEVDFILRIVTRDVDAYEKFFFEHLSRLPGIQEINSTIALSEIKASTALPLSKPEVGLRRPKGTSSARPRNVR